MSHSTMSCPCGLGMAVAECCGRWHGLFASEGRLAAPTAEALMRSRYTAFALLGGGAGGEEAGGPEDEGAEDGGAGAGGADTLVTESALIDYLHRTWASETRPSREGIIGPAASRTVFTRLAILAAEGGGPFQDAGTVEFVALGTANGRRVRQHEVSAFRREDGVWLYVDGRVD